MRSESPCVSASSPTKPGPASVPCATTQRTPSGQRIYDAAAVERVRLLRRLYQAGLTSSTIAAVLPCVDSPSEVITRQTLDIMRNEHTRITNQIAGLTSTREDLIYLIDRATDFHDGQLATTIATTPTRQPKATPT